MAYIVIVNPSILAAPGTGMNFDGVLTATVILSFAMTLLMGLYAKSPLCRRAGNGRECVFRLYADPRAEDPVACGVGDDLLGRRDLCPCLGDAVASDDR